MPLHPQSQDFIRAIAAANAPTWPEMETDDARNVFCGLELYGHGPELHSVSDATVDSVPVRLYEPTSDESDSVIVYFHGGGWVLGDLNTHDTLCRKLAVASACRVVSVHYRRAPEYAYPAAFDDCYSVVQQTALGNVFSNAPKKLVVAGDSAGGNLAAAVSLKARDTNGLKIAGQVLIYPALDAQFETESYSAFAEGHGLTAATMQWFWKQYLGEQTPDKYAAPDLETNLNGLPPVHIVTAEFDVLRDEGEAFGRRLQNAGVATTIQRYDGMLHGFMHFSEAFDDGDVAIHDCGRVIQNMVEA